MGFLADTDAITIGAFIAEMDFGTPEHVRHAIKGIDNAFKEGELLLLCNPHNPTGRVFSPEELLALCRIKAALHPEDAALGDASPASLEPVTLSLVAS